MRAVNIRALKAGLSRYLRDVRAGDVIVVTDRGTVVAELRPPAVHERVQPGGLQRLVEEGLLQLGAPQKRSSYPASSVQVKTSCIDDALSFVRGSH